MKYKKILLISIPITLQSLISISVNLIGNIMLGKLGEVKISAASLASQYISFYFICCMGIGMGASVMVSRFWGMQDLKSLKQTITLVLRVTIIVGLIFTLFAVLMPEGIMRLYTNDENVIAEGVKYFKWASLSIIIFGISTTCTIVLRSTNQTRIPLIGSCFAFALNILANYTFIYGNFGFAKMGIEGAAIAVLISRIFEFLFNFGYFLFFDKKIAYRFMDLFGRCREQLRNYINIGLPVLFSDVLLGLSTNVVAMVMGRIGSSFVAANAITMIIQQLSTSMIQGVSQAGCIITGQTIGKGDSEAAKKESFTFLRFGIYIGIFAGILIMIIGEPIINMYNINSETKQIAMDIMKAVALIVVFQSANSIITKGVLRSGGKTMQLMIADNIFMCVASIPLGIILGIVLKYPPFFVYIFLKIDQILKFIWCIYVLKKGNWIKKF